MTDIFEHTVLCKKCNQPLVLGTFVKNGFQMRALVCPRGHEKLVHPVDTEAYKKYIDLKNKEFKVKMRIVGNSYAVSIPKEIVSFMHQHEKMMDDMVRLCFEESGRLTLRFDESIGEKNG